MGCCESGPASDHQTACCEAGNAAAVEQKFQEFLKAAAEPGALDRKTKQAIAIALSVLARCEPCVKSHMKKARDQGFLQEEIDEAAWLAIGFGGSPTMVFYNAVRKS
jgi:AhpD family alkylhydroperoxidase